MNWEVVPGTDPRCKRLVTRWVRRWNREMRPVFPLYWEEFPGHYLLFYNRKTHEQHLVGAGREIKFLSSIDVSQRDEVISLLNGPNGSKFFNEIITSLTLCPRVDIIALGGDGCADSGSDKAVICEFQYDGCHQTRCFGGGSYAVYFDRPFEESCHWARQFEETIQQLIPNIEFYSRIGICNDCRVPLNITDHEEDRNIQVFLCKECRIKRQEHQQQLEEEKKRKRMLRKQQRQLNSFRPLPSVDESLVVVDAVRRALHQTYRGKCQYCPNPRSLPIEETHVEHIIPRSISLGVVCQRLQKMGVTEQWAQHFCHSFLPPLHDCVLNYSLACRKHNNQKSGNLLSLAALELLLRRSKSKARKVLELYSHLKNEGGVR